MDNYYRRFTQHRIKGKVFDPFPWIPSGKNRETIVTHYGNLPHIGNSDRMRTRIGANDVISDGGHKLRMSKGIRGCFRENTMWKYHDPIMTDSCHGFVTIHPLKPFQ